MNTVPSNTTAATRIMNPAHDAEIPPGLNKTFFIAIVFVSALFAGGAVGHAVATQVAFYSPEGSGRTWKTQ